MSDHAAVQQIAKETMRRAHSHIRAGQKLIDVRAECEADLLRLGADDFWYWNIGAFIFAGKDTIASVSGRSYQTPDYIIQEEDLITIDLSPRKNGQWGDFARTLIVENGKVLTSPLVAANKGWREGVQAELALHQKLIDAAYPSMTFEQLHRIMNQEICGLGYENLDFLGNLGHSIDLRPEERIYIEKGNTARLDSVEFFTFEPHIRRPETQFGFKHENIYRFLNSRLAEL